jgi:AcrR family transcriptional regulator
MPKAFSEREKEIIGGQLLEQGYKLFSTYGLKKTNIEELAAAAGISKGAFYLFYDSKEALFMDVAEITEQRFRQEILSAVDLPGSSPRARLVTILKKAFSLLKTVPLMQFFNNADYSQLFRRLPPEKLQKHLSNDLGFIETLVERCRQSGIPIRVEAQQVSDLLYALFFASLHQSDLGQEHDSNAIDLLLQLTAAYCLGEIALDLENLEPEQGSQP